MGDDRGLKMEGHVHINVYHNGDWWVGEYYVSEWVTSGRYDSMEEAYKWACKEAGNTLVRISK